MLDIIKKVLKGDFSGNSGRVIKNSIFQFSNIFFSKLGALIFSAILVRILRPELFGVYSLTISVIVVLSSLSDFGIDRTAIITLSKARNSPKFNELRNYFIRLKIFSVVIVAIIAAVIASKISQIYNQPSIFYGLLAGIFYIIFSGLVSTLESVFQARENFKVPLSKEIWFNVLRILLVLPLVFILLRANSSWNTILFFTFFGVALSYLFTFIFLLVKLKIPFKTFNLHRVSLDNKDRKAIRKTIYPIAVSILAGILFSYLNIFMLGYFVAPEYVGYYQAAAGLLTLATPLSALSIVMLPVFSRLGGKKLKQALKKSYIYVFIASFILFLAVILLAPILIRIFCGPDYAQSVNVLRILSPLFMLTPLGLIFYNYLISTGKQLRVSLILFLSSLINVILNLILILKVFNGHPELIILGVASASVISNLLYFVAMKFNAN